MKLHYTLASTYSAEGITLGGTENGITEFVFDAADQLHPAQQIVTKEQLNAFLKHPSTVFRMKNGTIKKVTAEDEAGEGEVITLEDDEAETEGEESEDETTSAKRSRARRS